jgi:hypothetical protein
MDDQKVDLDSFHNELKARVCEDLYKPSPVYINYVRGIFWSIVAGGVLVVLLS